MLLVWNIDTMEVAVPVPLLLVGLSNIWSEASRGSVDGDLTVIRQPDVGGVNQDNDTAGRSNRQVIGHNYRDTHESAAVHG